ncbi:hypothetical protein ACJZ2D_002930 [Fusarium nematophilum]
MWADKDEEVELAPLLGLGDSLDLSVFTEILEMDDSSDREFSASIIWNFFDQAEGTFSDMDSALNEADLSKLSSLGFFLKGISATLGLAKIREECEKIQKYAQRRDDDGNLGLDYDVSLDRLREAISHVQEECARVKAAMTEYYSQFEKPGT